MFEDEHCIKGFSGKYSFLSNFDTTPFLYYYNEEKFNSVEQAFQFLKTQDKTWQDKIRNSSSPSEAKKLGRMCPMRTDWDEIKEEIMFELVYLKFSQNLNLKDLLLSTGNKYLEETNYWNDTYWGVCNGKGENHLGKILMGVREELRVGE